MSLITFNPFPLTPTFILPTLIDTQSSLNQQPFYVAGEQIRRLCAYIYSKWPSLPVVSAQKPVQTDYDLEFFRTHQVALISDEAFDKVVSCKEKTWSECKIANQSHKTAILSKEIIKTYVDRAKEENNIQYQAYFYAQAVRVIKDLGDHEETKLIPEMLEEEAKACYQSYQWATDPSEKLTWLLAAANLLDRNPEKGIEWSSRSYKSVEQYRLAGVYWNELGDFIIDDPRSFKLPYGYSFYSRYPEFYAPRCYKNAVYAFHNAEQFGGFNVCMADKIFLIDKAINAMESIDMKFNDVYFTSEYYEILSRLYQLKFNKYRAQKDFSHSELLSPIVYQLHIKSAEEFGKLIEKTNSPEFYYKKAWSLRGASFHVDTLGQAVSLLEGAAKAAAQFRKMHNLPIYYPTRGEFDEQAFSYTILERYWDVEKQLKQHGPDYPLKNVKL